MLIRISFVQHHRVSTSSLQTFPIRRKGFEGRASLAWHPALLVLDIKFYASTRFYKRLLGFLVRPRHPIFQLALL